MLGGDKENVGVAKVLAHQKQVAEGSANNDECPHALNSSLIRLFDLPLLNLDANAYYELADFNCSSDYLKQQVWLPKTAIYFILYCIILS